MSKNSIEDIVQKKSLKEVLPSRSNGSSRPRISSFDGNTEPLKPIPGTKRAKAPMWILWSIAVVLVFFGIVVVSSLFSRVTVEITPKQAMIVLNNETLSAAINAPTGQLEFGLVTREVTEEQSVTATGVRTVEEKASGQITVFNDFDNNPQELVTNTRFQTSDGKIYRIDRGITVPGRRMVDGQEVPGSIDVTVYADEPGQEYNIGLTDFTIPGFSGTPRFDGFYARSKTPMTGGFSGNIQTVSAEEETRVRESLRTRLGNQSNNGNLLQIPNGFILLADSILTHFESLGLETGQTGANQAVIREKMVVTGILINERQLASFIAQTFISDYRGEEVMIANLDEININLVDKEELDPKALSAINIEADGQAHIIWVVDEETLVDSIRGLNKGDFQNVITRFPSIESLTPKFRPPWMRNIPDNPNKIKVKDINE